MKYLKFHYQIKPNPCLIWGNLFWIPSLMLHFSNCISQNCYMDLLKLSHGLLKLLLGFVKLSKFVWICISCPLPNKTKLKLDQVLKACWSFCFELKVLSDLKYSMPFVRSTFGNGNFFALGKIEEERGTLGHIWLVGSAGIDYYQYIRLFMGGERELLYVSQKICHPLRKDFCKTLLRNVRKPNCRVTGKYFCATGNICDPAFEALLASSERYHKILKILKLLKILKNNNWQYL